MNQTQKPWAVAFWSVHPEELIAPDGTPLMSLDEVGGMMDDDLGQGAWAWVQANCPSYKIEYEYLPDPEMPCIVPWLVLSNEPEAWDFKLRVRRITAPFVDRILGRALDEAIPRVNSAATNSDRWPPR